MPHVFVLIFALIVFLFPNLDVFGQDTRHRTDDLIAALGKTKHKKKEKKGFATETYVSMESQAIVKNNIREYAGFYESSEGGSRLELRVSNDGTVTGNGYDYSGFNNAVRKGKFTLRNARIEGALLSATKVYTDGATENFEAVFNNRTTSIGKNPNQITSRETRYGLGYIIYGTGPSDSYTSSRIFLEFRR
jgi:hypothetical protein